MQSMTNTLLSILFDWLYFFLVPSNPDCNETEIIVINKTSKSIALYITNDKDLCIQIQLQPFNKTCSPAGPVIFQNLKFSQRYDFSIFSYEKGNTTRTSLSPSSCSFSTYTCKSVILLNSSRYFKQFCYCFTP